jgi:ribosomal protein L34E
MPTKAILISEHIKDGNAIANKFLRCPAEQTRIHKIYKKAEASQSAVKLLNANKFSHYERAPRINFEQKTRSFFPSHCENNSAAASAVKRERGSAFKQMRKLSKKRGRMHPGLHSLSAVRAAGPLVRYLTHSIDYFILDTGGVLAHNGAHRPLA